MFYRGGMRVEYREEPCRTALNRVKGMPFDWSLNPYTGCAHRCTFCYVRAFEARADRPSDDRYGRSIRVKVNVADMLRRELSRPSWKRESVAVGAATDPYQPAEGRYRLTRACIVESRAVRTPFSLITRGPMVRRDVDVLVDAAAARRCTSASRSRRSTSGSGARPSPARPAPRRLETVRVLTDAGIDCGVALAPILPGLSDDPQLLEDVVREARAGRRDGNLGERAVPHPGRASTSRERWPETGPSCCPATSGCTRGARTSPRPRRSPSARPCRPRARVVEAASAGHSSPEPEPEQLALSL